MIKIFFQSFFSNFLIHGEHHQQQQQQQRRNGIQESMFSIEKQKIKSKSSVTINLFLSLLLSLLLFLAISLCLYDDENHFDFRSFLFEE